MLPSELPDLPPGVVVAVDSETSGLYEDDGARVSTVSVAWESPDGQLEEIAPGYQVRIISMAWPFDQGTEGKPEAKDQGTLWSEAANLPLEEWRALLDWLERRRLVMHNGKFDIGKFRVGVRRWPGVGRELIDQTEWDTQNVNHLLWPLERTSLKPTFARIWPNHWMVGDDEAAKVKAYLKKQKLPAGRWDLMPWDIVGAYADNDSRMTKMLELRQRWEIDHNEAGAWLVPKMTPDEWTNRERLGLADTDYVYGAIHRRLEVMKTLYRQEKRGLPYDAIQSHDAADECLRRAKPLAEALPFRPTDVAAKDYFFTEKTTAKGVKGCNLIPYAVTEKGGVSMTADVLARMIEDQVPYAAKWGEYRKVTNAASMWYQGYADAIGPDGRLRTCFRQNGTVSSRFSVERVNLQAIPHDYRLGGEHGALAGIPTPRQLIAAAVPEGWKIYELDLAQAELRVAAMFAKCDPMLQMIANDEDLHGYTCRGLNLAEGPDDPRWFEMRQVGKRANFSLGFRAQWKTFAAMVAKEAGIRLEQWQSEQIVRDWNMLYPEFERANRHHEAVVAGRQQSKGHGWIDLLNKERRWYGRYDDPSGAFNQRVQGNLAQFGIDWMLSTDEYLRDTYDDTDIGGAGLVLVIHDSQVLLLPDNDEGKAAAEVCAQFGRDLWKDRFPGVPGGVDYHAW